MSRAYLLTGGNIADRYGYMMQAQELIEHHAGKIIQQSEIYETKAWGVVKQADYLNQVLFIETTLSAAALLEALQGIELLMGRKRKEKWGERVIDIDILFFDDAIINTTNLKIPHPWIAKRNFTLVPLLEIAADFVHPILHKTITEIAEECGDLLSVRKSEKLSSRNI